LPLCYREDDHLKQPVLVFHGQEDHPLAALRGRRLPAHHLPRYLYPHSISQICQLSAAYHAPLLQSRATEVQGMVLGRKAQYGGLGVKLLLNVLVCDCGLNIASCVESPKNIKDSVT